MCQLLRGWLWERPVCHDCPPEGEGVETGWPAGEAGGGAAPRLLPTQRLRRERSTPVLPVAASLACLGWSRPSVQPPVWLCNSLKVALLCLDQPMALRAQKVVPSISICLIFGVCRLGMAQAPLCPSSLPDFLPFPLNPDSLEDPLLSGYSQGPVNPCVLGEASLILTGTEDSAPRAGQGPLTRASHNSSCPWCPESL